MELLKKSNGNLARTPEEVEQMIKNQEQKLDNFIGKVKINQYI